MTIPLHQLYDYICQLSKDLYDDDVIIYRFFPDGSKNIQNLNKMVQTEKESEDWFSLQTTPVIWCHDQEPLNFALYQKEVRQHKPTPWNTLRASLPDHRPLHNINYTFNVFDKALLCHSEKRSANLARYLQHDPTTRNSKLISVYYWCHALISRDWFRYAEHEYFTKNVRKKFLIYNRSWTGTREYRLKFVDMLIQHDLLDHCLTFFNPTDNSHHYRDHVFANDVWKPNHILENFISATDAPASSSAEYNRLDYAATQIEVVLETLFDDDRLHLTEKSLRPIACRQPFILMATHGSLQYLRNYGFKTFESVWDESYDLLEDPYDRMSAVIKILRTVSNWNDQQLSMADQKIQAIVEHNQKHFFSHKFFHTITDELKTNLSAGFDCIRSDPRFDTWIKGWQDILKFQSVQDFLKNNTDSTLPTMQHYQNACKFIEKYSKKSLAKHKK